MGLTMRARSVSGRKISRVPSKTRVRLVLGEHRAEFAYEKLKEAIATGELKPGDRVREIALAEWLNVSRTPIREAFRRLESEGLLSRAPRGGLVVTELDPQQIHDLYSLREALEGMAASLAARYASDGEVISLRNLLAQQRAASGNVHQLAVLNREFHEFLYRAARNRYLLHALGSLRDGLALLRDTTYSVPERPAAALLEHEHIVDAIERRQSEAADSAAREHIQNSANARLTLVLNAASNGPTRRGGETGLD